MSYITNNNILSEFKQQLKNNKSGISFGLAKADSDLRQHITHNIYMGPVSLDSVYSLTNTCESLERNINKNSRENEQSDIISKTRTTLLINLRIILSQISNLLNPSNTGEYRKSIINHYLDLKKKNPSFPEEIIQFLSSPTIDKTPVANIFKMYNPVDSSIAIVSVNKDTIMPNVAGNKYIKEVIYDEIIDPIKNFDPRYDQKPNGILLYGPTGSGKSFIAEQISQELGYSIEEISIGKNASDYMNRTSINLTEIFDKAKRKGNVVILFNEFDSMAHDRGSLSKGETHKNDEVNTLLQCLEGCAENNVLVIATSNNKKNIDDAVLRPGRFNLALEVGFPDLESRIDIFRKELLKTSVGHNLANNEEDLIKIAKIYDKVSSATIVNSIVPAAKRIAKYNRDNLKLNYFIQAHTSESVSSAIKHDLKALEKYSLDNDSDVSAYSGKFKGFGFIPSPNNA